MKRLFDIFIATFALAILSPLLVVVAWRISRDLGKPVVFRQNRPGKNGVSFEIIKFRTMREPSRKIVSDADRMTPLGNKLRNSSIDELPELWNVLRGEMSLVGPRPLLEEYLPLYSANQARRHEVRPGITGWAQVNGRNAISWEEKFRLDVWYVDNHNFWLDLKILWKTIRKVIARDGISAAGEATMPRYSGQSEDCE